MKDPVVTSSGATYERVMIERWLKTHDTDPMTGVAIEKNMLSPNFAIKHAFFKILPSGRVKILKF